MVNQRFDLKTFRDLVVAAKDHARALGQVQFTVNVPRRIPIKVANWDRFQVTRGRPMLVGRVLNVYAKPTSVEGITVYTVLVRCADVEAWEAGEVKR